MKDTWIFIIGIILFLSWFLWVMLEIENVTVTKQHTVELQEQIDSLKLRVDSLEKRKTNINFYIR